jgi:hypothetical protein
VWPGDYGLFSMGQHLQSWGILAPLLIPDMLFSVKICIFSRAKKHFYRPSPRRASFGTATSRKRVPPSKTKFSHQGFSDCDDVSTTHDGNDAIITTSILL